MVNENLKKNLFIWMRCNTFNLSSQKFMPIVFTNSVIYKKTQCLITMTKY